VLDLPSAQGGEGHGLDWNLLELLLKQVRDNEFCPPGNVPTQRRRGTEKRLKKYGDTI